MWQLGPIGFTAPLVLWGLVVLPALWWLLRALPPAPQRRRFPGITLLRGLRDRHPEPARTPWWLLLLRLAVMAALILGLAGPVLHPVVQQAGGGPLLIVLDGSWAAARDWPLRQERLVRALDDAARQGRPVAVVQLTDPPPVGGASGGAPAFRAADDWRQRLASLTPRPHEPGAAALVWAAGLAGRFDTLWLADGLEHPGRAAVLAALERHGTVRVFATGRPLLALAPPRQDGSLIRLALRAPDPVPATAEVLAIGPDPGGTPRELARRPVETAATGAATEATVTFDLPPEIRNRITRFEIAGPRHAGAVVLTDDRLRRRKVALIAERAGDETLQLLSPLHYLRQALAPSADLITGDLATTLPASPDVVVLADTAALTFDEAADLRAWTERGGLLLRFAGPRLAAGAAAGAMDGTEGDGEAAGNDDPLLPIRLRHGGRSVGGALSWGAPRRLAPFGVDSPFYGLAIPDDVVVTTQVLARPDPDLAARTLAELADGTPLVTRRAVGDGQVVLSHVTANAEWSTLPLSGLFVQMLDRLAVTAGAAGAAATDLAGTSWQAERLLGAFGALTQGGTGPVSGPDLAAARQDGAGDGTTPPGLYSDGQRRLAVNVIGPERRLQPAQWPAHIAVEGATRRDGRDLKGPLLAAALLLLLADILATLALTGGWRRGGGGAAAGLLVAALLLPLVTPAPALADDAFALQATQGVVLAHVRTGNATVDLVTAAGLRGLGQVLADRTTVEPMAPLAIDLETDDLAFFPLLYWPVTADQPLPSPAAYRRLNRFLHSGGLIVFDTRDGDIAGHGTTTPEGQRLRLLAAPLDIPPLEPAPPDHVLTRSFYLLQDFPGRHRDRPVWVEAAPPDAETAEGMPFRNLNDGVTPVVIGGNDWAAAWALDDHGVPLFPLGRGFAAERQREMAWRFGVNLVMHVLTGNYKSDQVHVPALLERLGQ